ncbi:ATPase, F1 complex, gamma subunit protein [Actinidia rufa]|uniref:F-ATPase gamma subunit n=1 Tax=Actinidia rufa TaxID=165716 RepID=A0A7J0FX07_9ERIC|nr:ATPase, F1 complex, gamma subunit protein [Actinidia rufa]
MSCSNLSMWVSSKPSLSDPSSRSYRSFHRRSRSSSVRPIQCSSLRELRNRIDSVKSTQKITEAMKLVAAAKVRRAQEAVVNGRPFSQTLVEVLYSINEQVQTDDIDIPLTKVRPVKKVALVVVTGDRGLCGGFNSAIIKKAEARIAELKGLGLEYTVISVGRKGNTYFLRRPYIPVEKFLEGGRLPTAKEAQAIADNVFSLSLSAKRSTKLSSCTLNLCRWLTEDEFFRLTTKEGKLTVERDVILRALQESLASELAARMTAMSNATDNAVELRKTLSIVYNRQRQAKITGEILEIVAGADALS